MCLKDFWIYAKFDDLHGKVVKDVGFLVIFVQKSKFL